MVTPLGGGYLLGGSLPFYGQIISAIVGRERGSTTVAIKGGLDNMLSNIMSVCVDRGSGHLGGGGV